MKWLYNMDNSRVEVFSGQGIALTQSDGVELVPGVEVGEPVHPDPNELKKFKESGIVGIYKSES